MSIASRIEAIEQHLTDDYSVLTLAGANLTNVNKNILNLKLTWKERLLYFMNNGTQVIWNNWNKVSGTGTSLTLNNTEEAPMSLTYKGNTYQEGTPTPESPQDIHVVSGDNSIEVVGKNLLNINDNYIKRENATYSNITVSNNTLSFEITGSRSGYVGYIIPTTIGQTYTLSFNLTKGFVYTIELDNVISDINGNFGLERTTPYTYTATKQYLGVWLSGGNTTDNQASVSNLMLEKGNQATTYEEYKGASYPISLGNKELCKIGTYQDKINKSTGRNLCGYGNTLPYTNGGVTLTRENGYYKTTGTTSSVWFYKNVYTIPAGTLNGTYKVKKIVYNGTSVAGIRIIDRTVSPAVTYAETDASQTFTISNNNDLSVEITVKLNFASNETFNFILQKSTETDETYEPYGTGWYVKKEIQKTTITSDNVNNLVVSLTNAWNVPGVFIDKTKVGYTIAWGSGYALMNNYHEIKATANVENGAFVSNFNSTYLVLFDTRFTDISTARNILIGTEIYIAKATPTYETITDTTLIGQLEALKKSYENVTNISQVNNDLPFELSVTALEEMN